MFGEAVCAFVPGGVLSMTNKVHGYAWTNVSDDWLMVSNEWRRVNNREGAALQHT